MIRKKINKEKFCIFCTLYLIWRKLREYLLHEGADSTPQVLTHLKQYRTVHISFVFIVFTLINKWLLNLNNPIVFSCIIKTLFNFIILHVFFYLPIIRFHGVFLKRKSHQIAPVFFRHLGKDFGLKTNHLWGLNFWETHQSVYWKWNIFPDFFLHPMRSWQRKSTNDR